ncbi:MAG: hypothetical protein PHX08_11435 [Lachnospiraceae bacterium]|nr:hypothetical protein [Lachnospiraceae bacterium]
MTIDSICMACINAIRNAGYNESTVFNYEGVVRRFKHFCSARNVTVSKTTYRRFFRI